LVDFGFGSGNIKVSDREIYHQIKDVLRLKIGEKIILFDNDLNEAVAEIIGINKDDIECEIVEIKKNDREPKKEIILYCSSLKGGHFEIVAEKATEVGVKKIVPIICERTIKTGVKKERLEKIIKEAAEQSCRGVIPVLEDVVDFKKAAEKAGENDSNLLFDLSGEKISDLDKKSQKIGIWIGPEGGWSENEIKIAKQEKFRIISLSSLTFRAETAAIIASYLASL